MSPSDAEESGRLCEMDLTKSDGRARVVPCGCREGISGKLSYLRVSGPGETPEKWMANNFECSIGGGDVLSETAAHRPLGYGSPAARYELVEDETEEIIGNRKSTDERGTCEWAYETARHLGISEWTLRADGDDIAYNSESPDDGWTMAANPD